MKGPTFLRAVAGALLLSTAGALVFPALQLLLGHGLAWRGLCAGLGFAYLLVLLHDSPVRAGRISSVAAWLGLTAALFIFDPALRFWLLAEIGFIWLLRSLYRHGSVTATLADLGLSGLSAAAALATYLRTGSLFLTLWSLFLVQALYVLIPGARTSSALPATETEGFEQAYRSAEAALRRLSIRS